MTAARRESLVEQFNADPETKMDMAAARGAVRAVALLNQAVATARVSQRELAERVGVSESRVSQVLNGDGNVRVSTLSRFLRAAGYELTLDASPAEDGVAPMRRRRPRRSRGSVERASARSKA